MLELASHYRGIIEQIHRDSNVGKSDDAHNSEIEAAERTLFKEMAEICLWGNATDLSLLTSLSYEDIQKLQGSEARKNSEKNILVNDLDKAFDVLDAAQKTRKESRRVDIVLDNAGFELFVDLVLAGYLLATGLATEVVLHPKDIPWFVSDVLPKDFGELLNVLADPQAFYTFTDDDDEKLKSQSYPLSETEISDIRFLFDDWSELHTEGKLILRPNIFWTEGGSYWRLPSTAPDLYHDLQHSELVIFKGDLNYRKLTADVSRHLSIFFIPILQIPLRNDHFFFFPNLSQTGMVGSNNPIPDRYRTSRQTRLGASCPRPTDLQGRCGCWLARGKRRRASRKR